MFSGYWGNEGATRTALDKNQLRAYCRDHLANYKVPKRFHAIRELPMLPIGKVDKRLLEQHARQDR